VDFLGLAPEGDALAFPLTGADVERLKVVLTPDRLEPGRYVVVHPGASIEARRWPAERFAAVADELAGAGFQVVLTGVESERPVVRQVAAAMRRSPHDLCGRTDLGALGALVSGTALVVCNDTGISHVAAALQTPSVVVSTGNNPARWAPIDRRLHRVLASDG